MEIGQFPVESGPSGRTGLSIALPVCIFTSKSDKFRVRRELGRIF